ncbi:MAG: SusC/RagA family TonB-linked outer membrane protein, partial [Arachidicoccus sp.]|nr:SusC/RagA family TonB-linked outer membrane protein [Arachidicoccus sp.]
MVKNNKLLAKKYILIFFYIFISSIVCAQNTTKITGIVNNQKGEHLVNVTVEVENMDSKKKSKVLTDSLGIFHVDNVDTKGTYTFTVTAVGYLEKKLSGYKLKENTNTNIVITLSEDQNALSDVVITGYTSIQRKRFTGSYASLTAKELERDGAPDVTKMLEGQFAGVSLQNVSGTFGAAPKLRIRGATSLSGDNKPLWVIDGVVIEDVVNISNEALTTGDMNTLLGSSIAGISPSDVEDITILKDAAATALYGARAMNGVVVITTKKGKSTVSGYPSINYVGNFSRYIKPNYADFDIMNSAQQMGVLMEELNKGYYQAPGVMQGSSGGIIYQMYNQIEQYNESNGQYGLINDYEHKNAFLQRYANANTNWFDLIFRNSLMQEHALSVSSGTDKFQTYGSLDYLKDDGFTLGNSVERIIGNFRMNFKVGNKFKGEILSVGSVRNQRAPGTQDEVSEPVYGSYLRGFDINPYQYVLNTSRMLTAYDEDGNLEYFRKNYAPFNILNELNSDYMKLGVVDYKIQATAAYQILPSLEYSVIGAYRYVKTENQTYALENSNFVKAYQANGNAIMVGSNEYLYTDPDVSNAAPEVVLTSGGFYNINSTTMKNYYLRHALTFNKNFGEDHYLTAFASMEIRNIERQNEYFDGVGYQYENGGLVNPYYKYFKQAGEQGKAYFGMQPGTDRFLAYMAQLSYSYKNKYTITPAFRYDGSNKMGESKTARWLPTWNISGSWNINEESFWRENKILSSAALRASYGLVGNIGNATNSEAVYYNQIARRPYINDQETLTYINHLANSELTWEKQHELDLGANLGFVKNRFNLTFDFYKRRQFSLIGPVMTSGIGGEYQKQGNYASMKGQG